MSRRKKNQAQRPFVPCQPDQLTYSFAVWAWLCTGCGYEFLTKTEYQEHLDKQREELPV